MRKLMQLAIVALAMIAATVSALAWISYGWGATASVTTAAQRFTIGSGGVFNLKIVNDGSAALYAAVNCTTGTFATAVSTTNAVCIAPTDDFTFSGYKSREESVAIVSVCVQAASGTNAVYIAGW